MFPWANPSLGFSQTPNITGTPNIFTERKHFFNFMSLTEVEVEDMMVKVM